MIGRTILARPAIIALSLALGGCSSSKLTASAPPAPVVEETTAVPGAELDPGPDGIESCGFALELGALYERYHALPESTEQFERAVAMAENPAQKQQAYGGLARVKIALADAPGAIAALEQVRSVGDQESAGLGTGTMTGRFEHRQLVLQLGRLYTEVKDFERAAEVYQQLLDQTTDPAHAREILVAQVKLYRASGTIDDQIQTQERLAGGKPGRPIDERALRFLEIAYAADPAAMHEGPADVRPDNPHQAELTRVYERLLVLHPGDPGVQQTLRGFYEQAGETDKANRLAPVSVTTAASPPAPPRCAPTPALPPALVKAESDAMSLVRAGRTAEALTRTQRLASRRGVESSIVALRLYMALGRIDAADQLVDRATTAARTPAHRRELAFARESLLLSSARHDAALALYTEWSSSGDDCLRERAEQGRLMLGTLRPATPVKTASLSAAQEQTP